MYDDYPEDTPSLDMGEFIGNYDNYYDDVDELQENQDFAQDDDFHNYEVEDQYLDGMGEE